MNIDQVKINNKSSFTDYGLYIKERNLSAPSKRTISQTVAGMQGSYDFSKIFGEVIYEDRTLEYKFDFIGNNSVDLHQQLTNVYDWLVNVYNDYIFDSAYPNYHFKGSYMDASFTEDDIAGTLSVKFKVYPYLISNGVIAKTFNISSTSYQNISVVNSSSHRVVPTIKNDAKIAIKNGNGNILLEAGEWVIDYFHLEKGNNILNISGPANVTISFKTEVF